MVIIDSHMHIFPPLYTAPGFKHPEEHRQTMQLYISGHPQPIRRRTDHILAPEAESRNLQGTGYEPLPSVNFRAGRYGRFEWTIDGIDYYRQFLPPSLGNMESTVDFVLQQMANVGVDRVVLQNARVYGKLEQEFSDAVRVHPGKFIGLAGVDEPNAHTDEERAHLRRAMLHLGLRGVYYANRGLYRDGYRTAFDDERYEPYWSDIAELGAVVYWEIAGVPSGSPENYLTEIDRLVRWAERHPHIPALLTHGIPIQFLQGNLEEPIARLLHLPRMLIEVLYPIGIGGIYDYPYREVHPAIRTLYQNAGGHRLVWGSDMPNVERFCTYRQSLDYLARYCTFVPPYDMDKILGGNVLQLFGEA